MLKVVVLYFTLVASVFAFETTNIQFLYSNQFDGDAFIYDTVDGEKSTVTFEHYRTFSLGDIYMFVDVMSGKKFDKSQTDVYTEISPRFSLSKISKNEISFGIIKDTFVALQLNSGHDYSAYLGGLGVGIEIPGFVFFNLNVYYKSDNIEDDDTFQITPAYLTEDFMKLHFEGFMDITGYDFNTQNQLLYNISHIFSSVEQMYIGTEWIYYQYSNNGDTSTTNALQVMFKYKF